jgi:hypothetical protein
MLDCKCCPIGTPETEKAEAIPTCWDSERKHVSVDSTSFRLIVVVLLDFD